MLLAMARAHPMTPDERRRALIEATRPLLLEHGTSITTRQIAECADVAEGTIFRAFGTKQDLIDAVVEDCLAPEPVVAALDAIPVELDLEDTVTWTIEVLQARIHQVRSLMAALSEPQLHPSAPSLRTATTTGRWTPPSAACSPGSTADWPSTPPPHAGRSRPCRSPR